MIHYALACPCGHHFDGWFPSGAAFDAQCARGLVRCPACDGAAVARAPMAPAVGRRGRKSAPVAPPVRDGARPGPPVPAGMPDAVRAVLQRVRQEVERNAHYVGPGFAAEARRIHDGDVPPRPIYGEATESQAEALREEGIEVARIPWVKPADS